MEDYGAIVRPMPVDISSQLDIPSGNAIFAEIGETTCLS
jgi:hypothetical protein